VRDSVSKFVVFGAAAALALALFSFGLSYPLEARLRGDAYHYLVAADSFDSLSAALAFMSERTAGMPLFEFAVRRVLGVFVATEQPQRWVDLICAALLAIHLASTWFFARWMREAGCVRTLAGRHLLFFFLATFPALVGHTTTPLTDTLAIDLILCGGVLLARSLNAPGFPRAIAFGFPAGLMLGFSILVRSGSLPGVAAGLIVAFALSGSAGRLRQSAVAAAALGCLLVLAPYYGNCIRAHGTLCLQFPAFDPVRSAQAGLRGARTPWSMRPTAKDGIPTLPDPVMMANYGERCELTKMVGVTSSSFTGCLLSRPLAIPAFLFKKWAGLFDHFRLTPYVETVTPGWLLWLSRAYDGLAWIGFTLSFALAALALRGRNSWGRERFAAVPPAVAALAVYAVVMLSIHTALHVEDRYSFAWLPLCAVVLVGCGEKAVDAFRASGWRAVAAPLVFSLVALAAFLVQVTAWDRTPF
jgi:hypothetical protein